MGIYKTIEEKIGSIHLDQYRVLWIDEIDTKYYYNWKKFKKNRKQSNKWNQVACLLEFRI